MIQLAYERAALSILSSLQSYFQEYDLADLNLRREGWLQPVTFNFWRKLLRLRLWQPAPFGKGELWKPFSVIGFFALFP
jgi:glycosidase